MSQTELTNHTCKWRACVTASQDCISADTTHTHTHRHTHTHSPSLRHTHIQIHTLTDSHAHPYPHQCMHTHMHAHTHTQTNTHTYTQSAVAKLPKSQRNALIRLPTCCPSPALAQSNQAYCFHFWGAGGLGRDAGDMTAAS